MSVETVLGPITPEKLGVTLTHEHLAMKFTHFYKKPPNNIPNDFTSAISLGNVGYLRQYPYSCRDNLYLDDLSSKDAVLKDVHLYKACGGGTIVENTTEGLDRDVSFMTEVSRNTGVNVIAGTGFYISDMQAEHFANHSVEDMYSHMIRDLTDGFPNHGHVKAGFVGEIASVWPLKEFEKKAIKAAGETQAHLGCGVSFHPHRDKEAPAEIIRLYLEAGGRADKAVMSHLDRTFIDNEDLLEFAKLGTYCQYDLFGVEVSYYQLNAAVDMPSDAQRIEKIKVLLEEGHEDKITISHDIHTKHRLTAYGGHGYSHILTNVLPRMAAKGISQETIDKITITNPATWLTTK